MTPPDLYGLDWLGSLMGLTRLTLFSQATHRCRIIGWWLNFAKIICWGIVGYIIESTAMNAMNVVYVAVAIRGLVREYKKGPDTE